MQEQAKFPSCWLTIITRRENGQFINCQRNTQDRKRIRNRKLSRDDCCVNNLSKIAYRQEHMVAPEDDSQTGMPVLFIRQGAGAGCSIGMGWTGFGMGSVVLCALAAARF